MRRTIWVAAMLLCICLLFSACSEFSLSTEDLMQPPRLTDEQKAIEDALRSSVLSKEISYKYPKSGEHRSAFIFYDIDGDGQEEALVFYAADMSDYARLSVLDKQPDGTWETFKELSGPQKDVEFVSFSHITSRQLPDVVIGWSNPDTKELELGVYSFIDQKLESRVANGNRFDSYLIDDIDQDGLDELLLLTRNSGTSLESSWIYLLDYDGYSVELVDELPLSQSITKFAGVTAGKLSVTDVRRAVFVDELLVGNLLVTEVFTVVNNQLQPIIHYDMSTLQEAPETESSSQDDLADADGVHTLYEQVLRSDTTAICSDVNSDGAIEIPSGLLLPGYEDMQEEADKLYLTIYNRWQNGELLQLFAAAINRAGGYRLTFPDQWLGKVTIVSTSETNEWSFIEYNADAEAPLEDRSKELLRIRVVSQKDYRDKFIENYTVLGTRGAFTYYGYIPPDASGTLAITMDQLKNALFSLL